jgi:hypothetical protein
MIVVFCRKPKVSRASVQRLRSIDEAEACITKQAEARIQRWHANHHSEVPTPM